MSEPCPTNMSKLFIDEIKPKTAILCFDASGSILGRFTDTQTILQKMVKVAQSLGYTSFRVFFWNSDNPGHPEFKNGVSNWPYPVNNFSLDQVCEIIRSRINTTCTTDPSLAFQAVANATDLDNTHTHVILLTDGEMGWNNITPEETRELRQKLANSIKSLVQHRPHVSINIVAVEAINHTPGTETKGAGNDVYETLIRHNLTGYIASFTTHCPTGTSVHIQKKTKTPPGYLSYKSWYFSELRIREFLDHIQNDLKTKDQGGQLETLQAIVSTLTGLGQNKPPHIARQHLALFSRLFTLIDPILVQYMLGDAIESEKKGQAQLFAHYRDTLKLKFQITDKNLRTHGVHGAVSGFKNQNYISFPPSFNHRYFVCTPEQLSDTHISETNYPNSGFRGLPCIPTGKPSSPLAEQALRQWARLILSARYKQPIQSDEHIYLVLGWVIVITRDPIATPEIVQAYRMLGHIMLNKNHNGAIDKTYYQYLCESGIPMTNRGNPEDFFRIMRVVADTLGFTAPPMRLWEEMCRALDGSTDGKLYRAQLPHFTAIPGMYQGEIKIPCIEYTIDKVPIGLGYEYQCPVTGDPTHMTGGKMIKPHPIHMNTCHPMVVFTHKGVVQLQSSSFPVCPCCFRDLDARDFVEVGPRPPEYILPDGYLNNPDAHESKQRTVAHGSVILDSKQESVALDSKQGSVARGSILDSKQGSDAPDSKHGSDAPDSKHGSDAPDFKQGSDAPDSKHLLNASPQIAQILSQSGKILVLLRGTVGPGKSTFAKYLAKMLEDQKRPRHIVSMDLFCAQGYSFSEASRRVEQELRNFIHRHSDPAMNPVIIMDLCNETLNKTNTFFKVDLRDWKQIDTYPNLFRLPGSDTKWDNLNGYLAWSLRNVLARKTPGPGDTHWLNPIDTSVAKCMEVHKKKASSLFGGRVVNEFYRIPVQERTDLATRYAETLRLRQL